MDEMDTTSGNKAAHSYVLRSAHSLKKFQIAKFDEVSSKDKNEKEWKLRSLRAPVVMYQEPEKLVEEEEEKDDEPQGYFKKRRRKPRKSKRIPSWVIQDGHGDNRMIGSLEGGQAGSYMLFMKTTEGDFQVIPIEQWFRFRKALTYRTLTLEEAEELNNEKKRAVERWLMKGSLLGDSRDNKDSDVVAAPRYRTGAVATVTTGSKVNQSEQDFDIFKVNVVKGGQARPPKRAAEGGPTGDDGGDFEEKFDDDESDPETTNEPPPTAQSDEDEYEIDGTEGKGTLTETGQAMKDLLKRHQTGEIGKGGGNSDEEDEFSAKDMDEYVIKRDLGGNIIRVKKEDVVEDAKSTVEKGMSIGKRSADDMSVDDKKEEPPSKQPRIEEKSPASVTSTTTAPRSTTATRLTEASVQQELIRYGGRMKTRDLLKRFKKLLNTQDDKALFRDILRTICSVEVDPIDGRILVLKTQFM